MGNVMEPPRGGFEAVQVVLTRNTDVRVEDADQGDQFNAPSGS